MTTWARATGPELSDGVRKGKIGMAELKLVRLDYRLIHGQVVTQWSRVAEIDRIVVVNDGLADDPFMADIYRMSAPRGVRVDVLSVADACDSWKREALGEGSVLLLFKQAEDALRAYEGGLHYADLQVGGCGGGEGSVTACGIAFHESDVNALTAIEDKGVAVHVHVVPTQPDYPLCQVIEKLHF